MKVRSFYVLDVEKGQIIFRREKKGGVFEFWTISDGYGNLFYQFGCRLKSIEAARLFILDLYEKNFLYWESDYDPTGEFCNKLPFLGE